MFFRFVAESIRRAPRRKALTMVAVAMGTAVATAMLGVMLDIGDKVNRELRAMGANIVVTPRARVSAVNVAGVKATPISDDAFIPESSVPKLKSIFWALNITGFAPSLTVPVKLNAAEVPVRGVWFNRKYKGEARAGLREMNPAWKVNGRWVEEDGPAGECMAGAGLGLKNGEKLDLFGKEFTVVGVQSTGSEEDSQILIRLGELQPLVHREGLVDSVQVAALTIPEDDFAKKDPKTMTPQELERWSCTNYVRSVAHDIEGALPMAVAKPVWRVADGEGRVLSKIGGLMGLIALAALIAAGMTVWSVMATTVMERRGEIAIMQATGATDLTISAMFCTEVALQGFVGGLVGAVIGLQLAGWVGQSVFGSGIHTPVIVPPLAIGVAVLVAIAGALPPLRKSLALSPAAILRERG
jgi:putative ABC transport system permease protein